MNDFDLRLLESNKIGAKTLDELFRKERSIVSKRVELLKFMPPRGNLGYDHLKAIHFFLFRDVYSWAGKDRADMGIYGFFGKEDSSFCRGELIPKEADKIFTKLKEQDFFKNAKDINELAKNMANFMSDLNALHPFREGNGRTQRFFLRDLAKNIGYKLDLDLITKERMRAACIDAMSGKNTKLETLIKSNLRGFRQYLDLEQSRGLRLK